MSSTSNVKESLHYKFDTKIRGKATKVLELIEKLEYLPENLPDVCEPIITIGNTLRIGMPLDPPINNRVRQRFIEAGFEVDEWEIFDQGYFQTADARLKDDEGYTIVIFDLACFQWNEGSTCKIEVVGEVTETKKVFEVICTEGAEEKVFA